MPYRSLVALLALSMTILGCPDEDPGDGLGANSTDDDDTTEETPYPLTLALTGPGEGSIGWGPSVAVSGEVTGDDPLVTVTGADAVAGDGTFTADVAVDEAAVFTPLLAEAEDASGWLRDRRTYLHGDSAAATLPVQRGLAMRITDHGLDGVEAIALGEFNEASIEQMILGSNPLYSGLGIELNATAADVGAMALDLDAEAGGLGLLATLTAVSIDVEVDAGILGSYPGNLWLDQVDVEGLVTLSAVAGDLVVAMPETAVDLIGLQLSFDGIWEWVMDIIAAVAPVFLEDMMASMLSEEVVTAVDDLLGSIDEGFAFGPVTIGISFAETAHDVDGVNIVLDLAVDLGETGVEVPTERVTTDGALPALWGSLTPVGQVPYGVHVVLDDDALNAIGLGLYASGELALEIEGEIPGGVPMTLTAGLFKGSFPSLDVDDDQPVTLRTAPSVSPVGTAAEGPDGVLDFHLPGFGLAIDTDLDGSGEPDPAYDVTLDAVVQIAVDAEAGTLDIFGGDMASTLIACDQSLDCDRSEGEGLAELMRLVIPLAVEGMVGDLMGLIPGVTLWPLEGGACGSAGDHASFYADMLPVE